MNDKKRHTILITGCKGQLGSELIAAYKDDEKYQILATDVETLDITNAESINSYFDNHSIDYVVNCAAFTAVDKAESDVDRCYRLNAYAAELLAIACQEHDVKLLHISTDYVFDGKACQPYKENDITAPTTIYGKSKLDGERLVMSQNDNAIIIRTAWLYSVHGKNFVKTILDKGRKNIPLKVVSDQVGTPTSATDLAYAIKQIIGFKQWLPGIYHYTNEGVTSWYDFAKVILRLAAIETTVTCCDTEHYPTAASRPHYSVLNKSLIKSTFNLDIPYWIDSLSEVIDLL